MNPNSKRDRRRALLRAVCAGVAAAGIVLAGAVFVVPSQAGAVDDSSVTFTAQAQDPDWRNAPFPDLEVSVSQTRQLVDQGITISWRGGKRSSFPDGQTGGSQFLQVMQCWGDETDASGAVLGPDRTTCQYGSSNVPGTSRNNFRSRMDSVAEQDRAYTALTPPFDTPYTSIPFRSVTGKTVADVVNGQVGQVDVNNNEFFSKFSTNEVPWAGTSADGTGSVNFEVQTGLLAPGLGCGDEQKQKDGTVTGRSCWLVLVPRGANDAGESNIINSGLFWDAWKHRLAVKLDFLPLGTRCPIGAAERQVVGSELALGAVGSWQPAMCAAEGGSVYSMIKSTESDAVLQANAGKPLSGIGDVPLALTSRPLGDAEADRLQYAPVALTSVAIAFAIDRQPLSTGVPEQYAERARQPFTSIKLTPRLVAKLLSYSYLDSIPVSADRTHLGSNPRNLAKDPEFIALNGEEWKYQSFSSPAIADMLVPQGRSDAAWALWQYATSDESARAFLAGTPDDDGMVVNPWYSTSAEKNPTTVPFATDRDNFPKADPVETKATDEDPAINLVTWRPYVNDLSQAARLTLRGDGQIVERWDATAVPPRFLRSARDLPGAQQVLGVTDGAAAEKYHVVVAELQNPAGGFAAPTTATLQAAAAAMTTDAQQQQVLGFDPDSEQAKSAKDAYPLTMPVYAASRIDLDNAPLRAAYAAFIRYAAGQGQESGSSPGQLPAGYAPLPDAWRTQAAAAAQAIESGALPSTPTPSANGGGSVVGLAAPATKAGAAYAPPAAAAPAAAPAPAVEGQPAAVGVATTILAGKKSAPDPELGGFGAVVPASGAVGIAAALTSLFFSRRRLA